MGNSKLCMDHRDKIKGPDPVVKDLTSKKKRTKYDKKKCKNVWHFLSKFKLNYL